MYLENSSPEQLRDLLSEQKDDANHILWVTKQGELRLTRCLDEDAQRGWKYDYHQVGLFRIQTLPKGDALVGPSAAKDEAFVSDLHENLVSLWRNKSEGFQSIAFRR